MAKQKHFPTGSTVRRSAKFLKSIGLPTRGAVDGLVLGTSKNGRQVLVAWSDGYTTHINTANLQKASKQPDYDTRSTVTLERVAAREKMDAETWTPAEIEQIIDSFERDDMPRAEALAAEWDIKRRPEVVRRHRAHMQKVAPLENPGATENELTKRLKF